MEHWHDEDRCRPRAHVLPRGVAKGCAEPPFGGQTRLAKAAKRQEQTLTSLQKGAPAHVSSRAAPCAHCGVPWWCWRRGAVLATAAVVAWIACWAAHLPMAAGWVLGAVVAPSDAAAAVAVLDAVSLPRRTISVLKGESLFNDAMALLLFNAALWCSRAADTTLTPV